MDGLVHPPLLGRLRLTRSLAHWSIEPAHLRCVEMVPMSEPGVLHVLRCSRTLKELLSIGEVLLIWLRR